MRIFLLIFGFMFCLILNSQTSHLPKDLNDINADEFKNRYFNIQMKIKDEWKALNQNQLNGEIAEKVEIWKSDFNTTLDTNRLKRILNEDLILLMLVNKSANQENSNFMISWEPRQNVPENYSSEDYLIDYIKAIKLQFNSADVKVQNVVQSEVTIDNVKFVRFKMDFNYQNQIYASQYIHCTILKDCYLKIMFNYSSNKEEFLGLSQTASIKIKNHNH